MKTRSILFALFAITILFTSCKKDENVTPSNNVTTVDKNITGYSQLDVSDPFKVFITFSETEEVIQVEANENLHQHINVEKENEQLVISIDDDVDITGGNVVLNIYITTSQLDAFYGAGATTFQLENELNGNNVMIELTGASTFTGNIHVNQLNSKLIGASALNIEGSSGSFDIQATGASTMEGYAFVTDNLKADLEGGSSIYLTVEQELDVEAAGASTVYYNGDGVIVNQELSGGSQIIKM